MKYVMIDGFKPIIFSESQQHEEFKKIGNITGAGFVNTNGEPYGRSLSLGIGPGKDDNYFLTKLLKRENN